MRGRGKTADLVISNVTSASLAYWGKSDPNYPGYPQWHPLLYHSLDVVAVAGVFPAGAGMNRLHPGQVLL